MNIEIVNHILYSGYLTSSIFNCRNDGAARHIKEPLVDVACVAEFLVEDIMEFAYYHQIIEC